MKSLLLLLGLTLSPINAFAIDASSTDPAAIMHAVENRATGETTKLRLHITITDKAGRKRNRSLVVKTKEFEGGTKQLILFDTPADLHNAGMLSVDFDDGAKSDNQFLYLPSLGKTTRLASADKSGAFMGTDLTYSDMTKKDPDAYTYTMIDADTAVNGEAVWHIEATPKTDKERNETGYLKSQIWVSKEKMIPLQLKAWVTQGKRLKYTTMSEIKMVNGVWTAHKVFIKTKKGKVTESTSTLVTSDLVMNAKDVTDADFTEQRLERGL
jgi:hypothetical protein